MGPEIGSKVNGEALMDHKNAAHYKKSKTSEYMELDITGCADNCEGGPSTSRECNALTESSSSFGDTVSGTDYGLLLDNEEVESLLYGHNNFQPMPNEYREVFSRKKKLTDHWRKFISPVMWRCRWLELQIMKLESQSLKYDREIALLEQKKKSVYKHFSTEDFDVKSTGLSSDNQIHRVMKRKRRKKTEETTEVASYIAHHNLFSYYEMKRPTAYGIALEDASLKFDKIRNMRHDGVNDFGTMTTDGWASSVLGDNDKNLENIFLKIEAAQSKVHKLKNRIDKIVNENPMKFSSINQLYRVASSDDRPSPEDRNDELVRSLHEASQHISVHALDVLMPESAVRSHVEVMLLPSVDRGNTGKVVMQDSAVKEEVIEQTASKPAAATSQGIKKTPPSAIKPSSSKRTINRKRKVSWNILESNRLAG